MRLDALRRPLDMCLQSLRSYKVSLEFSHVHPDERVSCYLEFEYMWTYHNHVTTLVSNQLLSTPA